MDASIFGTVGGQRALAALSSLPQIAKALEDIASQLAKLNEQINYEYKTEESK